MRATINSRTTTAMMTPIAMRTPVVPSTFHVPTGIAMLALWPKNEPHDQPPCVAEIPMTPHRAATISPAMMAMRISYRSFPSASTSRAPPEAPQKYQ